MKTISELRIENQMPVNADSISDSEIVATEPPILLENISSWFVFGNFNLFEFAYSALISMGMALLLAFLIFIQNELSHYFAETYEGVPLSTGIRNLNELLQVATVHIGCCLIAQVMAIAYTQGRYYEYNNPYLSQTTFNKDTDLDNITNPICKTRFDYFNNKFNVFYGISILLYLVFQYYQMK